ncbi:MAG: hypothetical protein IJ455_05040 [Agathobacter sp.]|nr:hypothetical protein [Agathobacter sp.]
MEKSKQLMRTDDACLSELKVKPKCMHTKVSYKLTMYDEELQQKVNKVMTFEDVVAIEFRMNYFDNPIGAECCGFYEIFVQEEKEAMLERNFDFRRESFLFHEDYDYDPEEEADILNYRESIDEIRENIGEYRLFEQQTTGGVYLILAKEWSV